MTTIQKALCDIEIAWEEMKRTPVNMTVEEFEKRVLGQAKRQGTPYSTEHGKWLDMAKKAITNPNISQEEKNLYLAEARPPEMRRAGKKFVKAILTLVQLSEWAYNDLLEFLSDKTKDNRLQAFLCWRVFLSAQAYYKYNKLRLRGEISKEKYLKLQPTVVFRSK